MKVLIAPNSLKGSLTAAAVADAIERGLKKGRPDIVTAKLPIADGGDGTAEILTAGLEGTLLKDMVLDPLGRPVAARWGLLPDGTAVIDVAAASGLALLTETERDPLRATSYGTGQLMRSAIDHGCRRIVLGVGGSATVDGGAGIVEALGARLLDARGEPIARGGGGLKTLDRIDLGGLYPKFCDATVVIACDVTNPLLGAAGAAAVFAPQKGASQEGVRVLEQGLGQLADVLERQAGKDIRYIQHGGAAGGIPALLHALFGAELRLGIDFVLDALGFEARLADADLVISAEGSLDRQTLGHKGPYGVARRAKRRGVPVVVIAGAIQDDLGIEELGVIDVMLSICNRPMPLAVAMRDAERLVVQLAEQIARLLSI